MKELDWVPPVQKKMINGKIDKRNDSLQSLTYFESMSKEFEDGQSM